MMVKEGDIVSCVIPSRFTVNASGAPIALADRVGGKVVELNEYGNWEVLWPNGEQYSYESALLRHA